MDRAELLKIAKPVLFNTEMVRAILEGRKTVTRRVLKLPSYIEQNENGLYTLFADGDCCYENQSMEEIKDYIKPPFKAGDYLYVRETWTDPTPDQSGYPILYMAHMPMRWEEDDVTLKAEDYKWRPSIHMPKEAARIFLKVTDVRVERLQDMEEEDAINEGIHPKMCPNCSGLDCDLCSESEYTVMDEFMYLWNSTIKKADLDKYGWEANPWVWVIEFERVEVE